MTQKTKLPALSKGEVTIPTEPPTGQLWEDMKEQAKIVAQSGITQEPAVNVLAIALKGRELGIPMMAALQGIKVIKGNPTLSAETMNALVHRAGHKLRVIESSEKGCTVEGIRADDPDHAFRVTFDEADARRANLLGSNTWKAHPKSMYRARATSSLCRAMFPDVLMGASYTAEELSQDEPEAEPLVGYESSENGVVEEAAEETYAVAPDEDDTGVVMPEGGAYATAPLDEEKANEPEDLEAAVDAAVEQTVTREREEDEHVLDPVRVAEIQDLSMTIWGTARAVEHQVMKGKAIESISTLAADQVIERLHTVVARKDKAAREAREQGGGDQRQEDAEYTSADDGDRPPPHPDDTEGVQKGLNAEDMPATKKQKNYLLALIGDLNDEIDPEQAIKDASGKPIDDFTRKDASEWIARLTNSAAE